MARKRLYKHSYALGYNTRDNPTSIPFNSSQILENLLPNHPNPIPRNGTGKWGHPDGAFNGSGKVLHTFAYDSVEGNRLIVISESGGVNFIYSRAKNVATQNVLIKTLFVPLEFSNDDVSWVRIAEDVYLSNGTDRVYILEYQGSGVFFFRNANIARPDSSLIDNVTVSADPGGSMTADKFVSFAVTYVRRTDSGGLDSNGDPQRQLFNVGTGVFNPGVLESIEIVLSANDPNALGERRGVQLLGTNLQVRIFMNNLVNLDPQVTHVRVYRTLEFDTLSEALAASHRWLGDFPVIGPNDERQESSQIVFVENSSNATMAGNQNFSLNIGFDNMLAGRTMTFKNGRLWVGGVPQGGNERIGRFWYSVPPFDIDFPQKWYSMFLTERGSIQVGDELLGVGNGITVTGWKDVAHEDDEFSQIVDVSRNDIIFILNRSVWFLADGDPETFEPELLDRTNGCLDFTHSLVHIDDALYYLSVNGPAMIEGRLVKIINEHTASEVWPEIYDGSVGHFYGSTINQKIVRGNYVSENWILSDNDQIVCLYMPRKRTGFGPWKFIATAAVDIRFGITAVFQETELVVYPHDTPNSQFFHVLDPTLDNDDGVDFVLRDKSKALYMSERDREMFGEAAQLIMFVEFTDSADLILILHSDYSRSMTVWNYDQFPATHILQSGTANNNFRLNIVQTILEGFLGQHFEVEWLKTHATPYRFIHKGFTLETIIRMKSIEFISQDGLENVLGNIIETGTTPFDIQQTGSTTNNVIEGG